MPLYLSRFSYTPETWARLIGKPEDRRKAAQSYIESIGGKLHGFWYAFGTHDGYNLWEAPDNVSMAAVASIGHVGGVSSDQFWAGAIALHGRAWRRYRARTSASALNGLVYALGMARNLRLLARIRSDEEAPTPVRASARWWLNRPARVYASVRF